MQNIFMKARVNGHECDLMIDSEATHNFVTVEYLKMFELKALKYQLRPRMAKGRIGRRDRGF